MKIEVKIPRVMIVNDYHEVTAIKEYLREVLGNQIKVKEILGGDYKESQYDGYGALIYVGKRPSRKEIIRLLIQAANKAGYK